MSNYSTGKDRTVVATEIKRVQPTIPIVTVADDLELPYDALNSVDALVTKSEGAHFLGDDSLCIKREASSESRSKARTAE
jgi:hypothetical protein